MRRLLAVGLIAVLLIASLSAPGATQSDAPTTPQTITTSQEFDDVEFHILVYDNGSAQWTFRYERTLANEQERTQFQQFAQEFNNSQTELYTDFQKNAVELTKTGGNATGRVMKAENFSKNAYIGGGGLNKNRGIVEMSFKWSSFAAQDSGSIVIGDVFKGGLYLGENQTLVVEPEEGMIFESAGPAGQRNMTDETLAGSDTVSWSGPYEFNDQRPKVTFNSVQETTTVSGTTTPGAGAPPGSGGEEPNAQSPMMLFIAAVVLLIGLAAVFAWRQGNLGSLSSTQSTPRGGGGGATTPESNSGGSAKPAVSDEELLTDEARVKKLLRENGGRMKQVNIVDETGWSKSKVSMLLSEMEDEGEISKLRVGRENIISLDGHEPDAAGSPLDR
ncbi:hypothetical protein SAMN05421858_0911 [Haladaptatus litoreus]|uniref:IclR helix-turn-helix domain-containing protein n=1 Tax=Haladaptatus litoreus TaxID=553468 RepID=A0A1N6WXU9_9EURY|nr:hypothetical protein [Haladaptatus litoreus]SIQ94919.1 hypothetical protein SAMN05421858_0911 [Haladaptatus litoreus]